MISDDLGKQLHDRATRGQPLTAAERELLAEWYRRLDQEEARLFAKAAAAPSHMQALREQVNATLAQIVEVAQHIQTLNRENDALRNEIALLEQRLIQKAS